MCNHNEFDKNCKEELKIDLSMDRINTESIFGPYLIGASNYVEGMETKDQLYPYPEFGLYMLWEKVEEIDGNFKIKCIYVGKGEVKKRLRDHISKKDLDDIFYISVFECSNRVSKYLEQNVLDCYSLTLNKNENNDGGEKSELINYIDANCEFVGNDIFQYKMLEYEENKNQENVIYEFLLSISLNDKNKINKWKSKIKKYLDKGNVRFLEELYSYISILIRSGYQLNKDLREVCIYELSVRSKSGTDFVGIQGMDYFLKLRHEYDRSLKLVHCFK
ncbi:MULTISPECIES: hypothetical protein [unclassified Photobacterium]|uniref:hypothetical protein n=1 Tax=unclassified Photobacterium TaxID=2628852 RepID=UPI001EDF8CD9|nr:MULTISPECIES: hypothetical protein [unclassified Photobacterium]MCG3865806.1 hypothetical protein [Photobacterium sp. Ph6]MCG3877281.1 hypothetical protein [Photobacterium sp. Ph5]